MANPSISPMSIGRLDFAVDIETLSRSSNATIIGIAVKPFLLTCKQIKIPNGFKEEFYSSVDANSCIMLGMDIEPATCKWWAGQPNELKRQFSYGCDIKLVLRRVLNYIKEVSSANRAEDIRLWSQGTDFDISILHNALRTVYGSDYEQEIPWKYNEVLDARTFVKEGLRLLRLDYDDIPPMAGYTKHNPISDVNMLIHNVTWVNVELIKQLYPTKPFKD